MDIYGLLKLTLLDFPGKVACTVFTGGCNFRCPFCHNTPLVEKADGVVMDEQEFFAFLGKRQGILDAVCVSGGEPLMQKELILFMAKIKELGFLVKLDTNGSFPQRLTDAVNSGYCDYVAMDIKNSVGLYSETAGVTVNTEDIIRSIDFIKGCGVDHEFRTTVVKDFHTTDSIRELTSLIQGEKKYFLQPFRDSENVMVGGLCGFTAAQLQELLDAARQNVPDAQLRGI